MLNPSRWTVHDFDAATRTVQLAERPARLSVAVRQTIEGHGPLVVAEFDLVLADEYRDSQGALAPLSHATSWTFEPGSCFAEIEATVAAEWRIENARASEPEGLVRTRGGKGYQRAPEPSTARTGYLLAACSADANLYGILGVDGPSDLVHWTLRLSPSGESLVVPVVYPKPAPHWLYAEHSVDLAFAISHPRGSAVSDKKSLAVPAHPFLHDGELSRNDLQRQLREEYGNPALGAASVRPRRYEAYLRSTTSVGRQIRGFVDEAANFVNSRIPPGAGFSVTSIEIASLMLSEGVAVALSSRDTSRPMSEMDFSAYMHLGIDSFIGRFRSNDTDVRGFIRDYTHPDLVEIIHAGRNEEDHSNERGDVWTTFGWLRWREAALATAAIWTDMKARLASWLQEPAHAGPWACQLSSLPQHVQYFWTSVVFNRGPETALPDLFRSGIEAHDTPWMHEDDHDLFATDWRYNAPWRTATFRMLLARLDW